MKTILFSILFFFSSSLIAQVFIPSEELNWQLFEKKYSKEHRLSEIMKIDHWLVHNFLEYGNLEQYFNNFHFVDYNFNGFDEIIYSGMVPGSESQLTFIFELIDENYLASFGVTGKIISIHSFNGNLSPFSFVLLDLLCCGDYVKVYEIYHPVFTGEKFKLAASTKYITIDSVEFPSSFFDNPVLFEVVNEPYHLRSKPEIDNDSEYIHPSVKGNIIGSYTKGSRGYAFAEKKDDTGRIWWFVAMVNNEEPLHSVLNRQFENNNNKFSSLGWMSSRFLEIVK
jgi:hypothetical protein